ncbi:MAG: PIN domain-containing protein [Betaproteobacteria bacterium]|nr:MAG: PIN domain-containing protein [Betaproteobacteria bacterium]
MNATVVDCSALAAVVFEEDWAGEVVPKLKGRRLIAPALLPFELAQVCSTKMRRQPTQSAILLDQFVAALGELGLDLEPVGFDELPALAEQHGLSCYDAAYLWLALAHQAPLVTFDRRLAAAYREAVKEIE